MEGWLLKSSGGKDQHRKTFGNVLNKWEKRWCVLRGGSTMLYYYKNERDADKGLPPSGGVDCHGSSVERVTSAGNIEFLLHTADRVLALRATNEDVFKMWVAAIVSAGGRAPLQRGALGHQGNLAISKSGKIVPNKPVLARSLSSSLDVPDDPYASTYTTPPSPLTSTVRLPPAEVLASLWTVDELIGEDPVVDGEAGDGEEAEQRKSIFDIIGEGITNIVEGITGGNSMREEPEEDDAAKGGAAKGTEAAAAEPPA